MTTIIPEPDVHNVWRTETPGNDGWLRSARPDAADKFFMISADGHVLQPSEVLRKRPVLVERGSFRPVTHVNMDMIECARAKFEQEPNNAKILDNIFRLVHTIKGTCGFIGLSRLEKVAHHSENVLGKFRDGEVLVTPDAVTLILESLDVIKVILTDIERTGSEVQGDDTDLLARLERAAGGDLGGIKVPETVEAGWGNCRAPARSEVGATGVDRVGPFDEQRARAGNRRVDGMRCIRWSRVQTRLSVRGPRAKGAHKDQQMFTHEQYLQSEKATNGANGAKTSTSIGSARPNNKC